MSLAASRKTRTIWMVAAALGVVSAACGSAAQSPPSATAEPSEIVATVNGADISSAELMAAAGARLSQLEEQAYALKRQQLDELIAQRLMEAEAKKRGIAVEALERQEIDDKVDAVTEADIDAFVRANAARLPADAAALRPRIRSYLAAERRNARRDAFVASLRGTAHVDVKLKRPVPHRTAVDAEGYPARGAAKAKVTIVEFSDFHCPACISVQPTLLQLLAKYPDDVRLIYRHLPLDELHPHARKVAEASWCADQQGRFWAFHDRVFAVGRDYSPEKLPEIAAAAGVDPKAMAACMADERAKQAVQKDVETAARLGVTGTPGFFINGRNIPGGVPLDAFAEIVEQELGRQ
jgi:protein-disulfide isomerase